MDEIILFISFITSGLDGWVRIHDMKGKEVVRQASPPATMKNDKRLCALVSLGLLLAALLAPFIFAARGRDGLAVGFGVVAGLLALLFGALSWSDRIGRTMTSMRWSCSSVFWFFIFAYVITGVGMCVNFLAFRRLPGGTPINSQTLSWLPYAPYVLWAGPCLAGGGSLFAVVLLHGSILASAELFGDPSDGVLLREDVIAGLLYAVIAVGLVWRYGAANLSWRDRVVAELPDQGA